VSTNSTTSAQDLFIYQTSLIKSTQNLILQVAEQVQQALSAWPVVVALQALLPWALICRT